MKIKSKTAFREPTKTANLNRWYRRRLLQIAKQVDLIAREFDEETDLFVAVSQIQRRLFSYEDSLNAYALDIASVMLKRADQADYDTWLRVGEGITRATRKRLRSPAIANEYQRMQAEQVDLIKTIPHEAAMKVHEWVRSGLANGQRFPEIAARIKNELGASTEARAICIARTETARARSNFTQARAKAVGSTGYIWRTAGDGAVRDMHARLDGTVQRWDSPPICEVGKGGTPVRSHPGCVWNCRCYPEPLFSKTGYEK